MYQNIVNHGFLFFITIPGEECCHLSLHYIEIQVGDEQHGARSGTGDGLLVCWREWISQAVNLQWTNFSQHRRRRILNEGEVHVKRGQKIRPSTISGLEWWTGLGRNEMAWHHRCGLIRNVLRMHSLHTQMAWSGTPSWESFLHCHNLFTS